MIQKHNHFDQVHKWGIEKLYSTGICQSYRGILSLKDAIIISQIYHNISSFKVPFFFFYRWVEYPRRKIHEKHFS